MSRTAVSTKRDASLDLGVARVPSIKHSLERVLRPLELIASRSSSLVANPGAKFQFGEETYELPRYLYIGPKGGDTPLRVGIFAGIHGDEPEGVHGLVRFVHLLERHPELAAGYCLFIYPVCNPTGFEDRTRHSRNGKDLNREFWRHSPEPEVQLLESEIAAHSLQGIISLHTDDTSNGFYGYAHGATLTKHLIEPALQAAEEFLPRNREEVIDGFRARNGVIRGSFEGILRGAPRIRPRPFELILETPQAAPTFLKEAAFVAALRSILVRYREFIAFAPNL